MAPHRDPNAETEYWQQMQAEADENARALAHEWEWDRATEAREAADLEAGQ